MEDKKIGFFEKESDLPKNDQETLERYNIKIGDEAYIPNFSITKPVKSVGKIVKYWIKKSSDKKKWSNKINLLYVITNTKDKYVIDDVIKGKKLLENKEVVKEKEYKHTNDHPEERWFKTGGSTAPIKKIWEEYEENEDRNDHSENVVLLAKYFGTKEDLVKAKKIQKKHDDLGHMPADLMAERDELSSKLFPRLVAEKKKFKEGGTTKGFEYSIGGL